MQQEKHLQNVHKGLYWRSQKFTDPLKIVMITLKLHTLSIKTYMCSCVFVQVYQVKNISSKSCREIWTKFYTYYNGFPNILNCAIFV